ncbi:uncharacterized protein LOC110159008 [Boleophthalmus pectinirostris]|uniref:uncharacterized protein LOC110159008 n=1 Tax=Boleophthalmus pectinirostris TaxID=150288 RepID=UPI00242E6CCE|nr:uncharacterized protein LOC110159008 [Boleophthalmus pectinirostris]
MWTLLYAALVFQAARCTDRNLFVTRSHDPGETITLSCPRSVKKTDMSTLHWIRVLSGNFPEFLGGTFNFEYEGLNKTPRTTTEQGNGTFDLTIHQSTLSDTGFYYCVKVQQLKMELVFGVFLKIKDVKVESPDLSGPVDSRDSVDLQCWVQMENAQCFEERVVCAVAACGNILFGNGTKAILKEEKTILILLSVALTISIIVILVLIYFIKKRTGLCFHVGQNCTDERVSDEHSRQLGDAQVMYSALKYKSKADRSQRRAVKTEEQVLYSDSLFESLRLNGQTVEQVESYCASDPVFETETSDVGQTVTLRCPRDSVDLQCWVQMENAQCFEEHMVLWFRSGLDQSGPGLVYTQRNSSAQCKRSTEDPGPHKCLYTLSKTMSPSDTGTYRCAVAACGLILFGNGTKVNIKGIYNLHII